MTSKRGGRVQVNMLQFYELVDRVEKLEAQNAEKKEEQEEKEPVLTKKDVIALLDEKGIKYNPRDKKDALIELLNKEVE